MEYKFSFAVVEDAEEIMEFMRTHWRKDHILAENKDLLLYDFQDGEQLNIGIVRDSQGKLAGIFGYMKYNSRYFPDIAGSLWKVLESPEVPMLGLKLRKFVTDNVLYRFFAAPGAGLQTKPIYRILGMNWNRMNHYYILNPALNEFRIAEIPHDMMHNYRHYSEYSGSSVSRIYSDEDLDKFNFEDFKHIAPFKDRDYVMRRFLEYPFRDYEIYGIKASDGSAGEFSNLFVIRKAEAEGGTVCRMVDFYGDEEGINCAASFLTDYIQENNCEYADFIAHGFSEEIMKNAGFESLDFDSDNVIIPNYFEPFERKNVPVYCVSEKTDLHFRQCKADGDQDRPNFV
jgi:hypothetical protein